MRTHPNHRRSRSALVATLAAGLLTNACGADATGSQADATDPRPATSATTATTSTTPTSTTPTSTAPSSTAETSPSSVAGDDSATTDQPTVFCDAVTRFDATDSPGGPVEPSAAELTEYAGVIRPMVDDMVADAPDEAVGAVATLDDAATAAAAGDVEAGGPALDEALATIEDVVRQHCDVAPIDVIGTDYEFEFPDVVPAGPVSLRMVNNGEQFHVLLLMKAPPETSDDVEYLDRFMTAISELESDGDPGAFAEFEPLAVRGNPPAADAGGVGTVVKVLQPGEYIYFCPIPLDFANPDSQSHYHVGMHGRFTVEG